jgi:hypothetical protein
LVSQVEQQKVVAQQHELAHEKIKRDVKISQELRLESSPLRETQVQETKPKSDSFWSSFAEQKQSEFLEKKPENPYSKPRQEDSGIPFKLDSIVNTIWGVFDVPQPKEDDDEKTEDNNIWNENIGNKLELPKEKSKIAQQVNDPHPYKQQQTEDESEKINQDDFALRIKQKQKVSKIKLSKPDEKKEDILEIKEDDDFFSSFRMPVQKKVEQPKNIEKIEKPKEVMQVEKFEENKVVDIPEEIIFIKKDKKASPDAREEKKSLIKEELFQKKEENEDFELLNNEPNAWDDEPNIDIDNFYDVEVTPFKQKEFFKEVEKEEKQKTADKPKPQVPEFDFLDQFSEKEQTPSSFDFDKIFENPSKRKEVEIFNQPKQENYNEPSIEIDDAWADQEINLGELEQEEMQIHKDAQIDATIEDTHKEDQEISSTEKEFKEETKGESENEDRGESNKNKDADQKQIEVESVQFEDEEFPIENVVNLHHEPLQNTKKVEELDEKLIENPIDEVYKT